MTTTYRPRLAVDVDPPLLGFCITHILSEIGVDEVVNLKLRGARAGDRFDAAVTSSSLTDECGADVVVELPDEFGNAGIGRVSNGKLTSHIFIDGPRAILEILDRYCPLQTGVPFTRRYAIPMIGGLSDFG